MLEILKELLFELKTANKEICPIVMPKEINKKVLALESVIEILERLRNNERNINK